MPAHDFPVIVIGLPRRRERRSALEVVLSRMLTVRTLFATDFGAVVDWRDWEAAQIEDLRKRVFPWRNATSENSWWSRDLKLGEIACTLSHWNVWTLAMKQDCEGIIVLEDDAIPGAVFSKYPAMLAQLDNQDPAWDLLYLARTPLQPDRFKWGRFVLPGFSYSSYAYVLSRRGIAKLLSTGLDHAIIPVDEFLPALYMPHPRVDVRRRFPPTLAAYALLHDVVRHQLAQTSGSDTEESPFLVPSAP